MATPLRLIILEDNPSDATLMLHALRLGGYDPAATRVENEQDYRKHLEPSIEIVLADFSLPEFNAVRAIEIMQELQLDIPLIIVSGTIGEEFAVKVMKHGAADYIIKDRLGRLAQAVTQALAQKELRADKRRTEQALRESEELSKTIQLAQLREQAARQQAELANEVMDQFFATLSHELRSPLTPMLGWCQMLLDGGLDEATRIKGLTVIERNVKMQCKLVEDIMDVSRVISGKLPINMISVDLNCIINAAIEVVQPLAAKKKIQIELVFPQAPVVLFGDPRRLEQIVSNLLSNAVKFTANGGSVQVSVISHEATIEILVKDSGIGISSDFIPHVFDRFSQADASCTREHGGLGIGLSLVKHLTELHGGRVRVESSGAGKGATFAVSLPIREGNVATAQSQPSGTLRVLDGLLRNIKLLIVDDEPDVCDLLLHAFGRYGAHVTTSGSVREAIAAYLKEKPDLILADLGMPFEDGFALIRQIRTLEVNSGRYTPAIALTAFAREDDRSQSLAAGFQLHISKPIEPDELVVAVSKLLNKSAASSLHAMSGSTIEQRG